MTLSLADIVMLIESGEDTGKNQSKMQSNSFNNSWVIFQMKEGDRIKQVLPSLRTPHARFTNPRQATENFLRINNDDNLRKYFQNVRNVQARAIREYNRISQRNVNDEILPVFFNRSALEVAVYSCYNFIKKYFMTPEAAKASKLQDYEISDIRNAFRRVGHFVDAHGDNNPSADLNINPFADSLTKEKTWKGKSISSTTYSRSNKIDKRLDSPRKPYR